MSNRWITYLSEGDNPAKAGLIPRTFTGAPVLVRKGALKPRREMGPPPIS